MTNRINKKLFIILLLTMLFTIVFPKEANAATYNTRTSLYNAGKNAVGNTVRIYRSGTNANDAFEQDHSSSQVYCVQHNVTTIEKKYYDYTVKNYIKISGNVATNSAGKSFTSNKNLALAYLIDQEGLRKGYAGGGNEEVRNLAIKHYLTAGGWMSDVGTSLGVSNNDINYFNINSANRSNNRKQNVIKFVNRAIDYSKKYATLQTRTTIEVEMWLCVKSNAKQNLLLVKSSNIVETPKGELTINKVDKDTNKSLVAGFKIQTSAGKWLSGNNGSYNYNNKFAKAQTYKSTITLKGLKYDTYKIYEVEAPNGYDIKDQAGYDKTNKWVYFGTVKLNAKSAKVTKKYTNAQKMSIKGYVWIDLKQNKDGKYNNFYDNSLEAKSKVQGVTVNLVNKSTKKAIATTKTNANGEYTFNKIITKSQLKDYYVEFDYSKLDSLKTTYKDAEGKEHKYINFIPVAFNSTKINEIKPNGSRALLNELKANDTDLKGIATTYKETDKNKEKTYGLSGNLCSKLMEGTVLNNINLGLKEVPKADYSLKENLEYVKISIRGHEYTYKYGVQGDRNKVAAPTVNWQKDGTISGYTANIYPSDIVYKSKNSKDELKVNVGYRIDITNSNNMNDQDLYKEKALRITSLTNKFDTNRYAINDSNWKADGDVAKYQKAIGDIGLNKTATIKINFSVNRNAIEAILEHPYGIIEKYPTTANTIGYHEYTRNESSWKNNNITHRTINDSRQSSAPYLIFKLGQERILTGRVFEDKVVTNDGQKLGNGVYDEGEKAVSGVKVELLDISGNIANIHTLSLDDINKLSASQLYRVKDAGKNTKKAIISTAMVVTDNEGKYTFGGIVPGYYFLRFTYGNGKQEITDVEGNKVNKEWISKIDDKEIDIKNYKSTIVTNEVAKNGLLNGTDLWYKQLGNANSSVTLDNLNARIAVNNGTLQNMMAGTAKLNITVENSVNDFVDLKESKTQTQQEISDGEKTANVKVEYLNDAATTLNTFAGLNLGIIEMPNQEAKLEKIITNMKLSNAQNNLIFNGNPETDSLIGVSDLDNVKGGSTYVRAELHDEMITGSTLELTYAIKVTNISDVNYYNNEYYWFGDKKDGSKEVTLVANELVDYLDETLQFNKEASDSRFEVITDNNIAQNEDLAKKTMIKLSNWNTKLYTEKNVTRNNKDVKTSDTTTLVARRVLSANDDDMEFINQVKTNMIRGTDDRDNSAEKETEIQTIKSAVINSEAQARATITPPTGADRQTIIMYTAIGVLALAILSAGVVVIKKYVVK